MLLIAVGVWLAQSGYAQTSIEELIEQTGVKAGNVAMRDHPGWREPQKIVLRNIGLPLERLQALLPDVEIVAVGTEAEALAHVSGADAVLGWCTDRLVAAGERLTWVQIYGAGAERCMPIERIADKSIVLSNMQKMSSPIIAEHMVAMMMSLARGLPQYARGMPEGQWLKGGAITQQMQTIAGKKLVVVGLGGIGTEIARRAAALGMRVSGTRRSSREGPAFVERVGLADELMDLVADADYIINALPLTQDTNRLFDATFFAGTKPGVYFLSVGRGRSVVTEDLVSALESGQVGAAGLDVTEPEPLPSDHPLWQMDNVLISPHVSAAGGSRDRHMVLLTENLRRFAAGEALLNVVDPDEGY
ncbi:MAG: D-2-hydroxyacid dehydrogenase [Pseudomonadota bacterium]